MRCANCGSENVITTDSRTVGKESNFVKRRKKCNNCGCRWKTYEISADMLSEDFIKYNKLPEWL